MKKWFITLTLIAGVQLFSSAAQAQSFRGTTGAFRGIAGYAGFGVAQYSVLSPTQAFRMDQGIYAFLGGERQMGKTGLFITLSLNYMDSSGQSFYDYTTLGGNQYSTLPNTEINFDSTHMQLGLGLKFKLFPTTWFRPYGEGGGLFGYHEITHKVQPGRTELNGGGAGSSDGNEKTKDGLTGFGYYAEAGLEIDFTDAWGMKAGYRYQVTETRPFETLGNAKLKYEARVFQFAISLNF